MRFWDERVPQSWKFTCSLRELIRMQYSEIRFPFVSMIITITLKYETPVDELDDQIYSIGIIQGWSSKRYVFRKKNPESLNQTIFKTCHFLSIDIQLSIPDPRSSDPISISIIVEYRKRCVFKISVSIIMHIKNK